MWYFVVDSAQCTRIRKVAPHNATAMQSLLKYIPDLLAEGDDDLVLLILKYEKARLQAIVALAELDEEEEARKQSQRKRKRRSCSVQPYLQRRPELGQYENLMYHLERENPELYRNFVRLGPGLFHEIVERVRPYLQRQYTNFRRPLTVGHRVSITLRFLATGDSYKSLGYSFVVAPNTISLIVPETCRAITLAYADEVLRLPATEEEWQQVAQVFEQRWNFPHVIGAIDGKHIRIKNPRRSGSVFFNHKRFYSIVLLALVDAEYNFLYVDIGAAGSESDAGVFTRTGLSTLMDTMQVNLPPPEPMSSDPGGRPIPYFMVGDDAFALKNYLMKPYPSRGLTRPQRIFNYRQSRARRVVENAFGILANR